MKKLLIFGGIGIVLIILIVVLISTLSKRNNQPQDITVKIWSPFNEGKIYENMETAFKKQYPNVKIEFTYIDTDNTKDYESQVIDAYANNNGPDIWLMRNDWLPKNYLKLSSIPSDILWADQSQVSLTEQLDTKYGGKIVEQNSYLDKVYGIPFSVDSLALYSNTTLVQKIQNELQEGGRNSEADILSETPKTWADVKSISDIINNHANSSSFYGMALGTVGNTYAPTDVYLAMLAQFNGDIVGKDNKNVFNLTTKDAANRTYTPSVEALKLYSSFGWNESKGNPVEEFSNGKVAMMVGYSSLQKEILARNSKLNYTIYPLPQAYSYTDRVDYASYWVHVVSSKSKAPNTSWRLLKALSSQETLSYFNTQTKKPAIVPDNGSFTSISVDGSNSIDNSLFGSQVLNSKKFILPDWQAMSDTISNMITNVLKNNISPQSAVDTASSQLDNIIGKNAQLSSP